MKASHKIAKHLLNIVLIVTLCISISLPVGGVSAGGEGIIDSLKNQLQKNLPDTTRINLLNTLGWKLRLQNPDTSILLGKQALSILSVIDSGELVKQSLATKRILQKLTANTNSILAVYYRLKSDYLLSLFHNFKALEIRKQLKDKKGIASSLGNIGLVYWNQGNYPKALKHYFEALEMNQELDDKREIAITLGNIGLVYWNQGNYSKALKHYFEALEMKQELDDKREIAITLGNIGIVYDEQGDHSKALKHYFEALCDTMHRFSHICSKMLYNTGITRYIT